VHYSHYRYAFPQLQPSPHSSFAEEQRTLAALLDGHVVVDEVRSHAFGEASTESCCWYAVCAVAPEAAKPAGDGGYLPQGEGEAPAASPRAVDDDDIFEVAMEGLHPSVCARFFGSSAVHDGLTGRRLAKSMASASGVDALVAGAVVDDWAFEPCGYSMNALRGEYYYTVHVTPETNFSYASFETNDPSYTTPETLAAIVGVFAPSDLTLTLTTRRGGRSARPIPASFEHVASRLDGIYAAGAMESSPLSDHVTIRCASYSRLPMADPFATAISGTIASSKAVAAKERGAIDTASLEDSGSSGDSMADSESTAPLDDSGSDDAADAL
jgi:hypothetical protein